MISRTIRKIITVIVACFMLVASLGVFMTAHALPGIVISGRVINTTTGKPIAGVQVLTCTSNSPVTDANGHWQTLVPSGTLYCARIGGGVPAGLVGPLAPNNNPDVRPSASYEYQEAGENCYHNPVCSPDLQKWDRAYDGDIDFNFANAPAKPITPVPAPIATPAPVTPVATPVPTTEPTPSVMPSSTPESSSSSNSKTVSFASDDNIATVVMPVNNFPTGTVCKITQSSPAQKSSDKSIIAGDYSFSCASGIGEPLLLAGENANWQIHLKGVLKNLSNPQAYATNNGDTSGVKSTYDKQNNVLSFSTLATASVYVTASSPNYGWVINALIVVGSLLILVAIILFFPLRIHRRRNYHDYLRSKYYNL